MSAQAQVQGSAQEQVGKELLVSAQGPAQVQVQGSALVQAQGSALVLVRASAQDRVTGSVPEQALLPYQVPAAQLALVQVRARRCCRCCQGDR